MLQVRLKKYNLQNFLEGIKIVHSARNKVNKKFNKIFFHKKMLHKTSKIRI